MADAHVRGPSSPADLSNVDRKGRIELMVEWFRENFDDPANSLPYESAEGGYQWIWGGPFDAAEELQNAFPQADEEEVEGAVERLEKRGTNEWTVASARIVERMGDGEEYFGRRLKPENGNPHRSTIVQTLLFPQVDFGWAIRASFIPGDTNDLIGAEITSDIQPPNTTTTEQSFSTFRELLSFLIEQDSLMESDADEEDRSVASRSKQWIDGLSDDADLFVDSSFVVHRSPPQWADLTKLGDGSAITAILFTSATPTQGALMMLAYGGSRVFVSLVKGTSYVTAAFFERVGERIKKGDLDFF